MPDVNIGELPFSYEEINIAAGLHKPGTQKSYNNETFAYWARALLSAPHIQWTSRCRMNGRMIRKGSSTGGFSSADSL